MHGDEPLVVGRRSVWYELGQVAQEDANLERILNMSTRMYPQMLIEDVSNHVMPYIGYQNRPTGVRLAPQDHGIKDLIASGISLERYPEDFEQTVYEFGRRCVANCLLFGKDVYEIVLGGRAKGCTRGAFSLEHIPPLSLEYRPGFPPFQRLPRTPT